MLGKKVLDKVSGLVGIVISKTEYLNGCIQYGVQPKLKKGSHEIITWSIDQEQLEVLGVKIKEKKKKVGGPAVCQRSLSY